MAGFPGGCKSVQEYCYFVFRRVTECIDGHKSKEETASYLLDQFQIKSPMTNIVAHTQNAQRDASASSSNVPQESATGNVNDALVLVQQPLSPKTETLQEMLSRLDQIKSIQDMLKLMTDGDGPGQRVENEPARDDVWQRVLNTLGQIQSTTEQILKLLTDGHGFGPRPSAAVSSKRQRVEKEEERGGGLQEKEEGDDEEAENQHKNEEGENEEAEKPQEKEEEA
ncbi:hypothetical protein Bca101_064318 [Brassica carinata]